MALTIKDSETERLARELASETGTTMTAAVRAALRTELEATRRRRDAEGMYEALLDIVHRGRGRPVLDSRTPDEIIGYDENGLPG